jgi:CRISPR-associated protein Cmx8
VSGEVILEFDPHMLPTAQHRAGLAGLLLTIKSLERRGVTPRPRYTYDVHGSVMLSLTEDSLQSLLDCVYAATTETLWVRTARKKNGEVVEPLDQRLRVENVAGGKTKTIGEYAYESVVPAGTTLVDSGMPAAWLKLWRDTVWRVLRAIPTTRGPYNARAAGKPVKESSDIWKAIGKGSTADVKGHMYLGAQETTADGVPYRGRASENLLLHFWPLVMGLGVVVALSIDRGQVKSEQTGFVITVPDVHDLEGFCEDFGASTAQLDGQTHAYFKDRPQASVLAVPQEGGLDYLARIAAVAKARATGRSYATSLSGTEVYYMKTGGQQPRLAAVARMDVTRDVLERYESVSTSRQTPEFRRQLITNVLDRAPWYRSFNRIFDDLPDALFIGSGQWFSADADRMFKQQQVRAEEAQ